MFFKVNDDEHDNIERAVESLKMWWVVLHNTTSPWNRTLSCDATNEVAVQKIISLKTQILPSEQMIIVQDENMLEDFICDIPSFIRQFLHSQEKYVTVIYPIWNRIAPSACFKDGSVPVRVIPSIDTQPIQMSRHVLRLFWKPIFVTSTTVGEGKMPMVYEEITDHIKKWVDLISPLIFGIDETGWFSMIIKYDYDGHIIVVKK